MDLKKYRLHETIIVIILGMILAGTFALFQYLMIFVFIGGVLFLHYFKKHAKIEDERILNVSEKASKMTVYVFGLGITIFSLSIMSFLPLLSDTIAEEIIIYANVWFWTALGLWTIYLIFYDYYLSKYGGF